MEYRKKFDEYEKILMQDDLAKFLGVNNDGILEFSYIDVVKSTGHSCVVVAGAYICVLEGLKRLYKDEIPKRGELKVEFKNSARDDNTGVVGSVFSQITGASVDSGFSGMPNGDFNRRDTLFFDVDMDADIGLTRLDSNKSVFINYRPNNLVNSMEVLMSTLSADATQESKDSFPERFQELVHTVFNNIDKVVQIKERDE